MLFVIAWNSVALAGLRRSGEEWRELDDEGAPVILEGGQEKALDTWELIAAAFPGSRNLGLRRNVQFWIGLRNRISHHQLPALDAIVIPQAQAGLLNLESVLSDHFGPDYLLGGALSVPLQLAGFRDPGVLTSVKKLQASLPLDVQTFLAQQAEANVELIDDPTYMLRVTFVPSVPNSGRSPDVIAYFVKPGEVTEELGQALKEYFVLPKLVATPRPNLIATQVVNSVSDRIPYRFNATMHAAAARALRARPPREAEDQTATDPRYCEYVTSVKRHLYTPAWIERLVTELSSSEGFRRVTGFEPTPR